jgi:hypothetical protein
MPVFRFFVTHLNHAPKLKATNQDRLLKPFKIDASPSLRGTVFARTTSHGSPDVQIVVVNKNKLNAAKQGYSSLNGSAIIDDSSQLKARSRRLTSSRYYSGSGEIYLF